MALVDTIIEDMTLFHDAPCDVLTAIGGWGPGAVWPRVETKPSGWPLAIPWVHCMEDTSNLSTTDAARAWRTPGPYTGNQAPNTRLQLRDLQMLWLLPDDSWVVGSHTVGPSGGIYPTDWDESAFISSSPYMRSEAGNGGGVSCAPIGYGALENYLWHPYGSPHTIPPGAIGCVSVIFGRLILGNLSAADDRHLAKILIGIAGDWYRDNSSPKQQDVNVVDMGWSRLKYATNNWQLFGFTNIAHATLRANPPPIIMSGPGPETTTPEPQPDPQPDPHPAATVGNWFDLQYSGQNNWADLAYSAGVANKIRRRRGAKLWS